jgi:hypothetical protein
VKDVMPPDDSDMDEDVDFTAGLEEEFQADVHQSSDGRQQQRMTVEQQQIKGRVESA